MKSVLIAILILLLMALTIYADHSYYNGKVIKFSKNSLTVDEDKYAYPISSNCRIVIHYQKKGAFYEKPASLRDLKVGDWVTIKIEKNTIITEIIIEEYRRK